MSKTYRLLDHKEPIPMSEIRRLYDGFWVFITKAVFKETGGVIEGIPVIIGSVPYDGVEDGIYEKYKSDEYAECIGKSLRHNRGFVSSLRIVGDDSV